MNDTPDDLLLLEAEHLARDIVLNADETQRAVAGLLEGWTPVIHAASAYFAPETVTPCSQVLEIGRGLRRDTWDWIGKAPPDARLSRIRELFEDASSAPETARRVPRRQNAVLQTCYLATHAMASAIDRHGASLRKNEATRSHGRLIAALSSRVRGAEQILDAHLSVPPALSRPPGGSSQTLALAIAAWDRSLHDALVEKTPDPRVLLVSANVSIGLLRRAAELASVAAANGELDSFTIHSRLLPALMPVTERWERARDTWRALAPATTGIPYPIATAAHTLHRALNPLQSDPGPQTSLALRLAIMATVEAAHLQVAATRRSDLKGMASGVSALTQAVFDHVPGARSLTLWRQLERLDGPVPISIPVQVRTEMLRQAVSTLEAATLAASASHGLIEVGISRVPPTREMSPSVPGVRRRGGIDRRL